MRTLTRCGNTLIITAALVAATATTSHAVQADDESPMVGTLFGRAGTLDIAGGGTILSEVEANSLEDIVDGSNGIGCGDFDNDGLVDYLIGGRVSISSVDIQINFHRKIGPGSDFAPGMRVAMTSGWRNSVMDFAVADYDEDGNMDFAVNDYTNARAHVHLGYGNGTFSDATTYNLPFRSVGMDAADVNNDGHIDFVAAKFYGKTYFNNIRDLAVFLGDGAGGFTQSMLSVSGVTHRDNVFIWGVTAADFDEDGNVDLVLSNYGNLITYGENRFSFYRGNGDGTFDPTPLLTGLRSNPTSSAYFGQSALDNADFNRDGFQDIICANFDGDVSVHLGNGDGTFAEQGALASTFTPLAAVSALPSDGFGQSNQPPLADAGGPYAGTTGGDGILKVRPSKLNLSSRGKWVTAYLIMDSSGDSEISLDGSASSDPDGDSLTYSWTVTDASGTGFTLTGATPSFSLFPGEYTVELVVDDGELSSEPSFTTISVSLLDLATLSAADLFLNGVAADRVQHKVYRKHWKHRKHRKHKHHRSSVLKARFDRSDLAATLQVGEAEVVTLSGAASGEDTIRVFNKERGKKNGRSRASCRDD